jgi:voltage-gated potassium channel
MFRCYHAHFWRVVWALKSVLAFYVLLIIAGAILISYTEQLPFDRALYFAFITGLTIGYGDIVATTALGHVISILLGITGILFTGLLVAAAVRAVQEAWKELHGAD